MFDNMAIRERWKDRHTEQKLGVLRMEFKKFLNYFVRMPCQLVLTARRIVFRLTSWNPWTHVFIRGAQAVRLLAC